MFDKNRKRRPTRMYEYRKYEYQPLNNETSVRILELLPAPNGSPLHCRLGEMSLSSPSEYEALSYVWGNPTPEKQINCDTGIIHITKNCSKALHHLRKPNRSRFLWVDSICIHQESPEERNHQVAMMGKVYSRAQRVVVWLGADEPDASFEMMTHIRHVAKHGRLPDKGILGIGMDDEKIHAVDAFFGKAWFSRTWPVQEVAYSQVCKIYVGHRSITADELMAFLTVIKDSTMLNDNLHRAHVHRQMWRYIRHVRGTAYNRRLTNSTAMLLRTQHLDSTDPKDKIFAIHGLLKEMGAHLPDPNYSKSVQQVYREAAAVAIRHDNSLHILFAITGESRIEGIPSWVPDWSCNRAISQIASCQDYHTERGRTVAFEISENADILRLWGVEVDKIYNISPAFPDRFSISRTTGYREEKKEIKILQCWLKVFEEQALPITLEDFVAGLSAKPWAHMTWQYEISTKRLAKYWLEAISKSSLSEWTYYKNTEIPNRVRSAAVRYAYRDGFISGKQGRSEKQVGRQIVRFHELMRTLLDRKVVFMTDGWHIGIASQALRVGDSVVFFMGLDVPMIVRRTASSWRLVAPAYIHGAMEDWRASSPTPKRLQSLYTPDSLQGFVLV